MIEYRSTDGKIATLNLSKKTISYDGVVILLADCSDDSNICLKPPKAKIVVPRICEDPDALEKYIPSSGDLELIGMEGLSGNVFKMFKGTDKFAYATI